MNGFPSRESPERSARFKELFEVHGGTARRLDTERGAAFEVSLPV
jgi:hypothetical protein